MIKKILLTAAITVLANNVLADTNPLKTQTGNEIGISISDYEYREPFKPGSHGFWMDMNAVNYGISYLGIYKFNDNWFALADLGYKSGKDDYDSSGSGFDKGIHKEIFEGKIAIGRDFAFDSFVLSPYIGLGHRYLNSKWRGKTSSGGIVYGRENRLFLLPIGITHKMNLRADSLLQTQFEFNQLLRGNQRSNFSETQYLANVIRWDNTDNPQKEGYGLKASTKYKKNNWSIGPYAEYFRIKKSNIVLQTKITVDSGTQLFWIHEPENYTKEYGLKASYTF